MITSRRILPINLSVGDEIFFQHELVKEFPDYHLTTIYNALITPDGVVLQNSRIEESSLFATSHKSYFTGVYKMFYLSVGRFTKTRRGQVILAFDAWSFGYFHWMTEFIPRLFEVKHLIAESTVILPSINNGIWNEHSANRSIFRKGTSVAKANGYYTESLDAFNLNTFYYHKPRKAIKAEKLLIPSHLAYTGNYNDEVMREIRSFYFSHHKIQQTAPSKRIFITRKLANRRRITNEAQVIKMVKKCGFEIVTLENLSFPEQVRLMSQTAFLIGQHGAGLTNLMFMSENSFILELKTDEDSMNHCYFSLASAMKIHYLYQFCKSDGRSVQEADILVNEEMLIKNIDLVLDRL